MPGESVLASVGGPKLTEKGKVVSVDNKAKTAKVRLSNGSVQEFKFSELAKEAKPFRFMI